MDNFQKNLKELYYYELANLLEKIYLTLKKFIKKEGLNEENTYSSYNARSNLDYKLEDLFIKLFSCFFDTRSNWIGELNYGEYEIKNDFDLTISDDEQYEEAKKAKEFLSLIMEIEKKYHIFIDQARYLIIKIGIEKIDKAINSYEKRQKLIESYKDNYIPVDFENAFKNDTESDNIHCSSVDEGLTYSIINLGRVDIEYISKITNLSLKEVINKLGDSIYQNPNTFDECFYKGWETKDEYLVGNLNIKYKIAKNANERYFGIFNRNLRLLEEYTQKIPSIKAEDIYMTLGSPWIPIDTIKQFLYDKLGQKNSFASWTTVEKNEETGKWSIRYYDNTIAVRHTYGTKRIDAMKIITKILNQKEVVIYDTVEVVDDKGIKHTSKIKNEKETILANEKKDAILKCFHDWIYSNKTRKDYLTDLYNDLYCKNYIRAYDGSFLEMKDASKDIKLYDYQKNAIARIIFSGNCLLAHDVGSGKTYEMIGAGHELIRMKLSQKNLFVVPNQVLKQWENMYKTLYPNANIKVVTSYDFSPKKRLETLKDIRDNFYDGIIMQYSSFDALDLAPSLMKKFYHDNQPNKDLSKFNDYDNPDEIYFNDLNIDYLFVDEAHNYKNIPLFNQLNIRGINSNGSTKCLSMLAKVDYVHSTHQGKGVIFATGTPITNSVSDAYTIQRYLQGGLLKMLGLFTFVSWIGNYAEQKTEFEIDVDTTKYRLVTRLSSFHNLPELSASLATIADFYHIQKQEELPTFNGYEDILINESDDFKQILSEISNRADLIRKREPLHFVNNSRTVVDNLLLVTHDGRNAALDTRLYDNKYSFNKESKVYECAKKVAEIYFKTKDENLTQLIFCDTSTPKTSFNIYSEIERILVSDFAINQNDIEFIHSATTDSKREKLFEKVNEGKIRILLGSTFKLGTGVNVQNKLYAIHHIDVPWRPADMVQREGRILRPGNTNPEIFIYRYITRNSFDAYSWQLLETKQKFISSLLNDSIINRDSEDISETVLNYAEIKALAIGNPLIKKKVEKTNELYRLINLNKKLLEEKENLRAYLYSTKERLTVLEKQIEQGDKDLAYIVSLDLSKNEKEERKELTKQVIVGLNENRNSKEEKIIGNYLGFNIIAPTYQNDDSKLNAYLEKEGRYHIVIKDSEVSVNFVLINFFKTFSAKLNKLKNEYDEKHINYIAGERKLASEKIDFSKDIEKLKLEINKINKELGLEIQEE